MMPSCPSVGTCRTHAWGCLLLMPIRTDFSEQVAGANEEVVLSAEDMLQCLERGILCRSVGCTSMNSVSSRSHAIFTVTIEQTGPQEPLGGDAAEDAKGATAAALICSKFHFVDLAGSERVKRTQVPAPSPHPHPQPVQRNEQPACLQILPTHLPIEVPPACLHACPLAHLPAWLSFQINVIQPFAVVDARGAGSCGHAHTHNACTSTRLEPKRRHAPCTPL